LPMALSAAAAAAAANGNHHHHHGARQEAADLTKSRKWHRLYAWAWWPPDHPTSSDGDASENTHKQWDLCVYVSKVLWGWLLRQRNSIVRSNINSVMASPTLMALLTCTTIMEIEVAERKKFGPQQ
jgi:hypothetical protein